MLAKIIRRHCGWNAHLGGSSGEIFLNLYRFCCGWFYWSWRRCCRLWSGGLWRHCSCPMRCRLCGRIDALEIEAQCVVERGIEDIDDLAHGARPLLWFLGE